MISAEEARRAIFATRKDLKGEKVSLLEALDRVLYDDVRSADDIPPFKNSSVDGFAVSSGDTMTAEENSPVVLPLQREIAAGDKTNVRLNPKRTIRVLTGAPVPTGADSVVPLEHVEERDGGVAFSQPAAPGRNIRERGEDIKKGEVVLPRGTVVRSAHLGVLASIGCARVKVFRKPTFAILTTGNELLGVEEPLKNGKIRNSNAYSLFALAKESGCEPVVLDVAKDSETELLKQIRKGLKHDFLVTSGGISVGKYDYVLRAMKRAGVDLKFWKVKIKPGMPFAFGVSPSKRRNVPVFCLPGNPVSTVVTFLEFVQPYIFNLMGRSSSMEIRRGVATLQHDVSKHDGKKHFHRGILERLNGELFVRSTGNQSSGVLTSLTKADCLIILDETKSEFKRGEKVEIEMLPWSGRGN